MTGVYRTCLKILMNTI